MTNSVLDVYNAALIACNGRGLVSDLNEASRECELCSLFYPLVRDTVQESGYWPATRVQAQLALLATQGPLWVPGSPPDEYLYSYAAPADYLRAWHMQDYSSFDIGYDKLTDRMAIYSSLSVAILTYACRNDNVASWTPGQKQATIYGLAGHIAGSLSGRSALIQTNFEKANKFLAEGKALASNATNNPFDTVPDWIQARGLISNMFPNRFLYPIATGFSIYV